MARSLDSTHSVHTRAGPGPNVNTGDRDITDGVFNTGDPTYGGTGRELWRTDGTAEGTKLFFVR